MSYLYCISKRIKIPSLVMIKVMIEKMTQLFLTWRWTLLPRGNTQILKWQIWFWKQTNTFLLNEQIQNHPLISDDREDATAPSCPVVVITSVNWSVNDFFRPTMYSATPLEIIIQRRLYNSKYLYLSMEFTREMSHSFSLSMGI